MVCSENMKNILKGVRMFEEEVYPQKKEIFERLATSQAPKTLFITCSDSRVEPTLITQTDPGVIFVMRNIGNIIPPSEHMDDNAGGVLEYAVTDLGVEDIIMCGHSNCGAMKALSQLSRGSHHGNTPISRWLRFARGALQTTSAHPQGHGFQDLSVLSKANIRLQMKHLRTYPFIDEALGHERLALHGWYYDIGRGDVTILDEFKHKEYSPEDILHHS